MRAINISNIKARNAQVGFEQKSIKHAFSMRRKTVWDIQMHVS